MLCSEYLSPLFLLCCCDLSISCPKHSSCFSLDFYFCATRPFASVEPPPPSRADTASLDETSVMLSSCDVVFLFYKDSLTGPCEPFLFGQKILRPNRSLPGLHSCWFSLSSFFTSPSRGSCFTIFFRFFPLGWVFFPSVSHLIVHSPCHPFSPGLQTNWCTNVDLYQATVPICA